MGIICKTTIVAYTPEDDPAQQLSSCLLLELSNSSCSYLRNRVRRRPEPIPCTTAERPVCDPLVK